MCAQPTALARWCPRIGVRATRINKFRTLLAGFAAAGLLSCTPQTEPPEQLDYRDATEGAAGMYLESLAAPSAEHFNLGDTSLPGLPQYAIKFGKTFEIEDSGTRNAILIECGMHGREWFAAESCYWLADYLFINRADPAIQALWQDVDIWIIPQSNPAGRQIDDLHRGDPTKFIHVCKGGSDEGTACTQNADCDSTDCYGAGWRTNANVEHCPAGVDLARNFSSDWGSAAACTAAQFMKYRGPHPFSEVETLNLRRFVHNHMISTVLIVHANSLQTWNQWASSSSANDRMVNDLVTLNSVGVGTNTEAHMLRSQVGSGSGQFSAWLTRPSDVRGELDFDTERNISTFYFELPISGGSSNPYYSGRYGAHDYRFAAGDGSNSFHPSSSVWYRLWTDSILPMMLYVIRQSASPQCPLDNVFARVTADCYGNDFGLVGMKIAMAIDEPGGLDYNAFTREEVLLPGVWSIVFGVQNFSSVAANTTSNAEIRIFRDGFLVHTHPQSISLLPGERITHAVEYTFQLGHTYRIEVELDADDFPQDNTKSMAFQVEPRRMLSRGILEISGLEIQPLDVDRDRWVVRGQVHDSRSRLVVPQQGEVELLVYPERTTTIPKPLNWKRPFVIQNRDEINQKEDVPLAGGKRPVAVGSVKALPESTGKGYQVSFVLEDPELALALAERGTVALRILFNGEVLASGMRPGTVPGRLKMNPANTEEDPEDEP